MNGKDHQYIKEKEAIERVRFYWQMPEQVIKALELTEAMSAVDFGAGLGYFARHIADRVGPRGKVYSVDKDSDRLQVLQDRVCEKDLKNIETSAVINSIAG